MLLPLLVTTTPTPLLRPQSSMATVLASHGVQRSSTLLMASATSGGANTPAPPMVLVASYALYALGFALLLVKTLKSYPLVPPSPNSLAWCRQWLWTTVADYYGAAFALCGVIIYSEQKRLVGYAWAAGCLFLGTPMCCMYVAMRLLKHGTLKLGSK